jgi:hypothetical protein
MNPSTSMATGRLPPSIATALIPVAVPRDSELVTVCAELLQLHARILNEYPSGCTLEEEQRWDKKMAPVRERLSTLMERSCTLTAATPADHLARAMAIVSIFPDNFADPQDQFEEMVQALLVDITKGGEV